MTVSNGEGNGELIDGYGFMLNNILGEDDVNPAGLSNWPTDTRLSSMMCPAIIEDADGTVTALGSGGSNRIRSAIAQVIVRLCVDGADLRTAVDGATGPRRGRASRLRGPFRRRASGAAMAAFPDHRAWPQPDLFYGGVHTARRGADGTFSGVGDARRDGAAIVV